jgi:predicted Zn finger-like uncharacterized protein
MYSQCPECLTRFRVTAAALRAAHGTVRCGRCGSAFDALPRLSDTLPEEAPEPAQPAALRISSTLGLTAAGEQPLSATEDPQVPEFHFSADDIEQVFIDVRDWQNRFGTTSLPDERNVRNDGEDSVATSLDTPTAGTEAAASDASEPPVWVHEPESIEDITLEGERIQIEHVTDFGEDYLEREIELALDEQLRAETAAAEFDSASADEAVPEARPADTSVRELGPTDRFAVVRRLGLSTEPNEEPDTDRTDQTPLLADEPALAEEIALTDAEVMVESPAVESVIVEAPVESPVEEPSSVAADAPVELPQPVTATAAAIAADATYGQARDWSRPAMRAAERWRQPLAPSAASTTDDEVFALGDDDLRLVDELAGATRQRRMRWAWGGGALLMALLLAAQAAHHFRQPLSRDASVGPVLRDVYARLGVPLAPGWDLAAFELRQWGAEQTSLAATSSMTIRASLKNGASFAQPMPLLRLELDDRFGGTVARRDFQPAEYLKDPAQAKRMLAPGAATEAELAIVDTASDAVGYRLDICVEAEPGVLRCAQPDAVAGGSKPLSR